MENKNYNYQGTGLGLSICQQLVNLMGGDLKVNSEQGQGSEFFFTLTLKDAMQDSSVNLSQVAQIPDLSDKQILICEDNRTNSKILAKILKKTNCSLDFAYDGQESLDKLRTKTYDLVLMDMQMPYYSGVEVTKFILKEFPDLESPFIALTANVMDEDRNKCLEAGMQAFLTKPVNRKLLFSTLSNLLCQRKTA